MMHSDKSKCERLEEALVDFSYKLVEYLSRLSVEEFQRLRSEVIKGLPEVRTYLTAEDSTPTTTAAIIGLLPLMRSCLLRSRVIPHLRPRPVDFKTLERESRRTQQLALDIDWRANGIDVWGQAYNTMLRSCKEANRSSAAKRTGAFFTPFWIVDHLLSKIPATAFAKPCTVLDPACGTGAFLTALWRSKQIPKRNAHAFLFGIDMDGVALAIAHYNLLLRGAPSSAFRLYCADALETFLPLTSEPVQRTSVGGQEALPSRFDVIVGNPPYGAEVSPWLRQHVKKAFATSFGHFDSYRLFLELILRKLAGGGYLGLVLSRSWMSIPSARKLRELFLSVCSPIYLGMVAGDAFGANVDTVVVVGHERSQASSDVADIEVASIRFDRKAGHVRVEEVTRTKLQDFVDPGTFNFIVLSDTLSKEILSNVERLRGRLCDQFEVSQGLIPYDRYSGHSRETIRERIWHSGDKLGSDYLPELAGKDIGIYGYKWCGNRWLKYGPWLGAPRDLRFFSQPRVLVQATRNLSLIQRVVAAYCEEVFVNSTVLNNILGPSVLHLKFLAAWLNSKLLNWYYTKKHPATIHVYPGHLRALPLPPLTQKELAEVGCLVDEMIQIVDKAPSKIPDLSALGADSAANYQRAVTIQNEIDDFFLRALKLNRSQAEIVRSHFSRKT